jgi:hypothetical protein
LLGLLQGGEQEVDAGFAFNYENDPNRAFVLISPGRSGLTARQVLDRLLGRGSSRPAAQEVISSVHRRA